MSADGGRGPLRARLYYCDHHEFPLPPGHKFPARKYRLLREALQAEALYDLEPAPPAPLEAIALAHESSYIRAFLEGTLEPAVMRRIGFPWSEGLVRRTLCSVGGTLAAASDALAVGLGGTLAGGTHHAFPGRGAGFCVFNDLAVAALSLLSRGQTARVAIVDLDVHQGDGTAYIFRDHPGVLTVSLHCAVNFPFCKQPSKIDVELPGGAGDDEYLAALRALLPRVFEFAPGIVFFQSGVDALSSDRLGRLALTLEGLAERDRLVVESCSRHAVPLAVTLGGGYSEPIERTVEAHANTFRIAARLLDQRR